MLGYIYSTFCMVRKVSLFAPQTIYHVVKVMAH